VTERLVVGATLGRKGLEVSGFGSSMRPDQFTSESRCPEKVGGGGAVGASANSLRVGYILYDTSPWRFDFCHS
jgi:hypothetical protein